MKKSKKKSVISAVILMVIFTLIFILPYFFTVDKKDQIQGLWLIESQTKDYLLMSSYDSRKTGKSFDDYVHISLIDPNSGKQIAEQTIQTRTAGNVQLICASKSHLWLEVEKGFHCYEIPSLKCIYDNEKIKQKILDENPEVKDIFKFEWVSAELALKVENSIAEEFRFSPLEFTKQALSDTLRLINKKNELGCLAQYEVFEQVPEKISITIEDVNSEVEFEPGMNLNEKLNQYHNFAKNYAVITKDTVCLLMDGDKRRTLKKLVSSNDSLVWKILANDKPWLNGQLLRPIVYRGSIPKDRSVITYGSTIFIQYHSSLDEEKDTLTLTAFDFQQNKTKWEIGLSEFELTGKYSSVQNLIHENLLLSLWVNDFENFVLLGIDLEKGRVKWSFSL